MRREERFVQSHAPYAVDLGSLCLKDRGVSRGTGQPFYKAEVDAVWFRRRNGRTVACVGYLWNHQSPAPGSAEDFLERFTDGRYGGECLGRWDGERYWGAQHPDVIERHLALLQPMLDNHPDVPPGYDGWHTFRTAKAQTDT